MAIKSLSDTTRRYLIIALVTCAVVFASIFGSVHRTVYAQYGACTYSEGAYSAEDHACGPSGGGDLSGTGRNWQYLLFAGLGLTLGISMIATIIFIWRKQSHHKTKS